MKRANICSCHGDVSGSVNLAEAIETAIYFFFFVGSLEVQGAEAGSLLCLKATAKSPIGNANSQHRVQSPLICPRASCESSAGHNHEDGQGRSDSPSNGDR
jgi:hypothetical protein